MADPTSCIVGVLHTELYEQETMSIMGTGFVVARDRVLTCAHVVEAAASGPGRDLWLRFQANEEVHQGTVLDEGWNLQRDVAVIALDGDLPQGVEFVRLGDAAALLPCDFTSLGYPLLKGEDYHFVGAPVEGRILQGTTKAVSGIWKGTRFLSLDGKFDKGYSGCPLLVKVDGRDYAAGMGTALPQPGDKGYQEDKAYGVRASVLAGALGRPKSKVPTLTPDGPSPQPAPVLPLFRVPFRRNVNFTGREELLAQIGENLAAGQNTAVTQAIAGLGGVGKTQLALEYCYRQRDVYDVVYWLPATDETTLAASFVELGREVGLPVAPMQEQAAQVATTRDWLRDTEARWLLVFDNADTVEAPVVAGYLPGGGRGHALITSRNPNWGGVAKTLDVRVFTEKEAVAFLAGRMGREQPLAASLAKATGYLPLALEHAAAYMEAAGCTAADYLALFERERERLWAKVKPPDQYHATITTSWEMAFERLQQENEAAIALLDLCSFLAADDIPLWLLTDQADKLPPPLGKVVADPMALDEAIGALRRYSLMERAGDSLKVHRMVQTVARDRMPVEKVAHWAGAAVNIVSYLFPGQSKLHLWAEAERALPNMIAAAGQAADLEVALEQAARVHTYLDLYLAFGGDFVAALPYSRRALAIREKALGPEHLDTALSLGNLGLLLQKLGDLAGARLHLERALAIDEKALGPEDPEAATSLNNLGNLLREMGNLAGARPYLERALAIKEKELGPEHPSTATSLNNLGMLLYAMGDLAGARLHLERALAISEKGLGPEHPDTANSLNNLGLLLRDMGDLAAARPYLERALAIFEEALGLEHPDTATSLNNLGLLLQNIGDLAAARPYYERALAIQEKGAGPEHPDTAASLNNLGALLYEMGDLAAARSCFERALAIFEEALGPEHPDTAQCLNNLGYLLKELGDLAGARLYYERAVAIREKGLGSEHPDTANVLFNLGLLLQDMGDLAGARPYYEQALAILEKALGPDHPKTKSARRKLESLVPWWRRYWPLRA
jgi:tetratricopeptide (TPR) repeat protein